MSTTTVSIKETINNHKHIYNFLPQIKRALIEDQALNDITSKAIIDKKNKSEASIIAKENGIICGTVIADRVFRYIDPTIKVKTHFKDGQKVTPGTTIMDIKGTTRSILAAERTALNFLQYLSGIATATAQTITLLKSTTIQLLDTRKTTPGYRMLGKYAVQCGGGDNHRISLADGFLIKDNHIAAAGSIREAIIRVRKTNKNKNYKIEVETESIEQVHEALDNDADVIMLDNMNMANMKKAIKIINGKAKTEVSGKITYNSIKRLRTLNIDYISMGALTHSSQSLDISLLIVMK